MPHIVTGLLPRASQKEPLSSSCTKESEITLCLEKLEVDVEQRLLKITFKMILHGREFLSPVFLTVA